MININNTSWDELNIEDVIEFLNGDTDETFFFEFKSDHETTKGLIKEISAFANTYGGYIFIGVNDDKSISGCKEWTEEKVHNVMHNCITPTPNFDVKQLKTQNSQIILIIKIEEGEMPPYITNNGHIYERVSSGSFPIKDSAKLAQLYTKHQDQLRKTENKIKLDELGLNMYTPPNLCGYLDIGFSLTCSERANLYKNFFCFDLEPIVSFLKNKFGEVGEGSYGISRVGNSFVFNFGSISMESSKHNIPAGIHNFIEIMADGSVKCRVILLEKDGKVDMSSICYLNIMFKEIYSIMLGKELYKIFISAHKYEKLTILRQFIPYFEGKNFDEKMTSTVKNILQRHTEKYGRNLIVQGNRIPKNGLNIIDKRYFDNCKIDFNNNDLINELFRCACLNLGYIGFEENEED